MQLPCQSGLKVFELFFDAGKLNDFSGNKVTREEGEKSAGNSSRWSGFLFVRVAMKMILNFMPLTMVK